MFSVVIPAYNREKELVKSIESVLNQTFSDFELIVVDNGSTDSTAKVVSDYMQRDPRIKYSWQKNSGSPAGSRNTGIENASRDWVAFLDSDDYWYPEKLEQVARIINEADGSAILISHFEAKEVDGTKVRTLEHGKSLPSSPYNNLLFEGNSLSTSAAVVKRSSLIEVGCFDTRKEYFAVEDYDLWMRLAKKGKFLYLEKELGAFCISETNMSGNIDLINNNLRELIKDHILALERVDQDRLLRKHLARVEYYRGRSFQLAGEFEKAQTILWDSLVAYPWSAKKVVSLIFSFLKIKK